MPRIIIERKIETDSGHKTIKIRELTIGEIIDLLTFQEDSQSNSEDLGASIKHSMDKFFRKSIAEFDSLTKEDLLSLTPSDYKSLWDAFKEANKSFFDIARTTGVGKVVEDAIEQLKSQIQYVMQEKVLSNFGSKFANSLNQAIQQSSNTDTPSLSEQ